MNAKPCLVHNAETTPLDRIPTLAPADFRERILQDCENGGRIAALFGRPTAAHKLHVLALLANEAEGHLSFCSTEVDDAYKSLTPACPQAQWFEREIAEQWSVKPEGHPWLSQFAFTNPTALVPPGARTSSSVAAA